MAHNQQEESEMGNEAPAPDKRKHNAGAPNKHFINYILHVK
jgi:hypothetical protein